MFIKMCVILKVALKLKLNSTFELLVPIALNEYPLATSCCPLMRQSNKSPSGRLMGVREKMTLLYGPVFLIDHSADGSTWSMCSEKCSNMESIQCS